MTTLPHALRVAYDQLSATLITAIGYYSYTNSIAPTATNPTLLDDIDRFVEELTQIPGAEAELQRRARFVRKKCAAGTAFDAARSAALASYEKQGIAVVDDRLTGASLVVKELTKCHTNGWSVSQLKTLQRTFQNAIKEEVVKAEAKQHFQICLDVVRDIVLQAERLQVEGVKSLWRLHRALSVQVRREKSFELLFLQSDRGGILLGDLQSAADAMMAWVEEKSLLPQPPLYDAAVDSNASSQHPDNELKPRNKATPKEKQLEWLARAMLLVQQHPDRSDAAIAEEVGKHPSTLSRSKEYQAAAAMARGQKKDRPRGFETIDRNSNRRGVEAIDSGFGTADDRSDRGRPIKGSKLFREYCAECGAAMRVTPEQLGTNPICDDCS